MGARAIKNKFKDKIINMPTQNLLKEFEKIKAQDLIHLLFSAISSSNQQEKQHAVKAFGPTMA